MNVTGTPSEELLEQITNCQVRNFLLHFVSF